MTTAVDTRTRPVVYRTRGSRHGGITRLMSPGDLGEFLKPFVFLDLFGFDTSGGHKGFGLHPHSGIATLTYLMEGDTLYDDTTGERGTLHGGGVEWMRAGNGVWHTGGPAPGVTRVSGFQLWVALPAAEENAPAHSMYLAPSQVPQEGPVRVLLGRHGAAQSAIAAPSPMNYLAVELKDGERWRYVPPAGHTVGWLAVSAGAVGVGDDKGGPIGTGELAVFEETEDAIDFVAHGDTRFVLGSAAKHPHELVMGHYSVHTSPATLDQGEAEIRRIGTKLRQEGRLG
ncbi:MULTISPECIES: pirin family protein [unclassified Variovorax]|uniref:pirin family protein n=1 Tax=unclassified Variovorax TaxID=663243 RepID=UPI0008D1C664|nr:MULTISPECIES: pirin family protein [unclassified Variovorax]SEJ95965.1 Redox-sensitive bicupin YhaK, pirin superfamily [Variovorax sp. OK202]SFD20078.1 Redox-sensitive bicupin YhaK, pirin superfamily [Variovorax sp. OK212]